MGAGVVPVGCDGPADVLAQNWACGKGGKGGKRVGSGNRDILPAMAHASPQKENQKPAAVIRKKSGLFSPSDYKSVAKPAVSDVPLEASPVSERGALFGRLMVAQTEVQAEHSRAMVRSPG